jgi:hypothetical protein
VTDDDTPEDPADVNDRDDGSVGDGVAGRPTPEGTSDCAGGRGRTDEGGKGQDGDGNGDGRGHGHAAGAGPGVAEAPAGDATEATTDDADRRRGSARRLVRALAWPLWNRELRRLRAPWRIAVGAVVLVAGTVATGVVVNVTGLTAVRSLPPTLRGLAANTVALAGGTAALIAVGAIAVDRRRVRDYGLGIDRDWAVDCAFGMALGIGLVSAIVVAEVAAGWLTVTGTVAASGGGTTAAAGPDATGTGVDGPTAILAALGLFVLVGAYEELLARGFLLTNLAEGLAPLGAGPAVALATLGSSGAFGAAHASNPNATLVSTVSVSFAGIVLAVGYLLTGEVAIPIGLHVTWNATLGVGYGLPVSGMVLPASVLSTRVTGPTVLTGGSFGPEAGLLGVAALLVGLGAIVGYVRVRDGRVRLAPSVVDPALRWRDGGE